MIKTKKVLNDNALKIEIFANFKNKFTKSDAAIANYIADNFSSVMGMTIAELSKATKVSEITISRFCKKISNGGLQDLKIALASSGSLNAHGFTADNISDNDSTRIIAQKIFSNIKNALDYTLQNIDSALLDEVADIIRSSKCIYVFGYGSSATVCRDLSSRFLRFGMCTEPVSDPHLQASISSVSDKDTLIFAVSVSGNAVDLERALEIAKHNGCRIVLLTSHKKTGASEYADKIIYIPSTGYDTLSEASSMRIIYLAILDTIYTRIALTDTAKYEKNISRIRASLSHFK